MSQSSPSTQRSAELAVHHAPIKICVGPLESPRRRNGRELTTLIWEARVRIEPNWSNYGVVLNTKEAAQLLRLHEESLRVLVRKGEVPCHRFPGGREFRFLRDELVDWLRRLPPDGHR